MQVTEVRIKLMEGSEDRLRAFCSITLDHCFVVRDLKIIDGTNGPFVAMPSRKLSGHCHRCHYKNHLRAAYCNQCGAKLKVSVSADSPQKLYADVAHPVNSECRELISAAVLAEFENELARAAEPGYRSRYDDDFDAISESQDDAFAPAPTAGPRSQPADSQPPATTSPQPATAQPSSPKVDDTHAEDPHVDDPQANDAQDAILRVDPRQPPARRGPTLPSSSPEGAGPKRASPEGAGSERAGLEQPPPETADSPPPRSGGSGGKSGFGEGIFD